MTLVSALFGLSNEFQVGEALPMVLAALATVVFCYYLYRGRGLPPGPWGLPVLGYLPWLDPVRPHLSLAELAHDYGPICSLRLGEVTAVLLSHPLLVKEALSKEELAGRAPLWLTHGLMNNNGLIAVEGEKWREQRKYAVNCLRNLGAVKIGGKRDLLEKRILDAVKESNRMLKLAQTEAGDGGFDPHKILAHNIGNLMNLLVFGKTFAEDDETWAWLQHLAEEGVKFVGVAGIINFLPILRFLPKYSRMLRFVKDGQMRTHDLYREIAQEKRTSKDNLISMYLEAMKEGKGKYFTDEQMVHVLADMFGAGLDTSLATMRWLLLYLAMNPQIQAVCHEEIDSAVGKSKTPKLDDMLKCPYTQAAILEAMRIRPVVPIGIPHGALVETRLSGYRIPAGTMIMVNQWALHHDVEHWKDPETFDPRHFLNSDGTIKKSLYFNPFQNGKRVCIGEEMAHMVLFLFAAGTLRRFRLEITGDATDALQGTPGITLCPGKHAIRFVDRELEEGGRSSSPKRTKITREEDDVNGQDS